MSKQFHHQATRIAVIDSHPIIRAGLTSVVVNESSLKLMLECSFLDEVLTDITSLKVDVVLLGIQDSFQSGLRDLETLREFCPKVATVVFSTSENEPNLMQSLLAGARGFLLSDFGNQEIVDAVRAAFRGKSIQVPGQMLLRLLRGLPWTQGQDDNSSGEFCARGVARLTNREKEVLQEMATGAPYRDIGDKLFLAESTVKKYAHSVITKLGASNRSTAVINAYRLNLLDNSLEELTNGAAIHGS